MNTFHLTLKSGNGKTGPIPVSTTSSDSCPPTCGQYQNCYAKSGPLALHWRAVDSGSRGMSLNSFCTAIAALPDGQLWRHNQAGDLPGAGGTIDVKALRRIVAANNGKRGFTYTHKPMSARNAETIRNANAAGFTVNLSADTIEQADKYKALNVAPVVVVVPESTRENFRTPAGHKVVICPAETRVVSCAQCKLCAIPTRGVIIAFPAHGSKKNAVTADKVFNVLA